jgi:hypothetical protein
MFLRTPIEVDGVIEITPWFWPEKTVNIASVAVEQPPLLYVPLQTDSVKCELVPPMLPSTPKMSPEVAVTLKYR